MGLFYRQIALIYRKNGSILDCRTPVTGHINWDDDEKNDTHSYSNSMNPWEKRYAFCLR
jgi:hypothetical protein